MGVSIKSIMCDDNKNETTLATTTDADPKDTVIQYLLYQHVLDAKASRMLQKTIMENTKVIGEQQKKIRKASRCITKLRHEQLDPSTPMNITIEISGVNLQSEDVIAEFTRHLNIAANRPIDTLTNNINITNVLQVNQEEADTLVSGNDSWN
jgi:hypothetical protein